MRLSALMELPTIFVFTHDAMGDGEDGPTHQPVEHLASLRAIPGLVTCGPATPTRSSKRTATSCSCATSRPCWCCRASRCRRWTAARYAPASGVARGAYVLADAPDGNPEVILIASGQRGDSRRARRTRNWSPRASAREWSRCRPGTSSSNQTRKYRDSVLPPEVTARIAIEQASTFGWERYVGASGRVIGMKTFGASAPLKELQRKFGFEPDRVVLLAKELLGRG